MSQHAYTRRSKVRDSLLLRLSARQLRSARLRFCNSCAVLLSPVDRRRTRLSSRLVSHRLECATSPAAPTRARDGIPAQQNSQTSRASFPSVFHRTSRPSSASYRRSGAASSSSATSAPRDWTRATMGTCTSTPALALVAPAPSSTIHFHRASLLAPFAVIPRASSSSRLGARASRDARGETSIASFSSSFAPLAWRARA